MCLGAEPWWCWIKTETEAGADPQTSCFGFGLGLGLGMTVPHSGSNAFCVTLARFTIFLSCG